MYNTFRVETFTEYHDWFHKLVCDYRDESIQAITDKRLLHVVHTLPVSWTNDTRVSCYQEKVSPVAPSPRWKVDCDPTDDIFLLTSSDLCKLRFVVTELDLETLSDEAVEGTANLDVWTAPPGVFVHFKGTNVYTEDAATEPGERIVLKLVRPAGN